jgi:hypothetical protein
MSTHGLFEFGIATIIAPLSMKESIPTQAEIETAHKLGHLEIFKHSAREIAVLDMYQRFMKKGWSPKLVVDVRNKLAPAIAKTITLVWFLAISDANNSKV